MEYTPPDRVFGSFFLTSVSCSRGHRFPRIECPEGSSHRLVRFPVALSFSLGVVPATSGSKAASVDLCHFLICPFGLPGHLGQLGICHITWWTLLLLLGFFSSSFRYPLGRATLTRSYGRLPLSVESFRPCVTSCFTVLPPTELVACDARCSVGRSVEQFCLSFDCDSGGQVSPPVASCGVGTLNQSTGLPYD